MSLVTANLQIHQGATFSKTFVYKSGGLPVDLTGYKARAQIRPSISSSTVLCDMTTENGLLSIEGTGGKIIMNLTPTVTETFSFSASPAVWDMELLHPTDADQIIALVGGLVRLHPEVTR